MNYANYFISRIKCNTTLEKNFITIIIKCWRKQGVNTYSMPIP